MELGVGFHITYQYFSPGGTVAPFSQHNIRAWLNAYQIIYSNYPRSNPKIKNQIIPMINEIKNFRNEK
jgi:hypothetical protein